MPGESYRGQLRSLLLYLCYVLGVFGREGARVGVGAIWLNLAFVTSIVSRFGLAVRR